MTPIMFYRTLGSLLLFVGFIGAFGWWGLAITLGFICFDVANCDERG